MRALPRAELAVLVAAGLLLCSLLVQRPFALMRVTESGAFLLRPWDAASLLVAAVAVAVLVRRRRQALRALRREAIVTYALFVAAAALSLVWTYLTFKTDGLPESVVRLLRLGLAGVLAVMVMLLGRRERLVLVAGIMVVSVAGALMAIWGLFDGANETVGGQVTRAGGPFGNFRANGTGDAWWSASAGANYLGFWLAVGLGMTAAWVARPGRRVSWKGWLAAAIIAAVLIAGLIATHSRESWVTAGLVLAVVLWFQRRPPLLSRWTTVTLGAPLLLLPVMLLIPSLRQRVFDTFTPGTFSYASGPQARFDSWEMGIRWGLDRFPIGWGLGAIEEHPELFGGGTAESTVIQVFAQTGLLGLIALLAFGASTLYTTLSGLRENAHEAGALYAAAFFVAFWVHGVFGNTIGDPTVLVMLGCALGLAVAPERQPAPVTAALAALARRTRRARPRRPDRRSGRSRGEPAGRAPKPAP